MVPIVPIASAVALHLLFKGIDRATPHVLRTLEALIERHKSAPGRAATSHPNPGERPDHCRNALRDSGKAYPKSGCQHCGSVLGGCPFERTAK